ncbi:MAG: TonB-dependent receptor [Saprospiraceae bacterium]|nr:MAG: TonB-dependent receptor [Saprospiraceae bacterium]
MRKIFVLICLCCGLSGLQAQCIITGEITDQNGHALPGANVFLVNSGQGAAADIDGKYGIKNVKPGKYEIHATFLGYRTEGRITEIKEGIVKLLLDFKLQEQPFTVDALVVEATRADEKTPMTYTNLDKEALKASNLGQDVPFLLRWTPSTVVTSDAGAGIGYTGMRIRGSDGERINVTINGIPLNDSESHSVFWVDLPDFISSAEGVQIQRGVGTSTNGAGAFGASINLNTNTIHEEAYARLEGTAGSYNTLKSSLQFGTGRIADKFVIDGRLSRISSDGYIDRASADLDAYFLSGAYLGKNNVLRFNLFSGHEVTYQAWNGVPADLVDAPETRTFNSAGTEKTGTPYDNEVDDYKQTHYQLFYNQQLHRNWKLNLGAHYTKGEGFFEQYKADEDFGDYGFEPIVLDGETIDQTDLIRRRWLDNDFYGLTYSLQYTDNGKRLQGTLGGAINEYKGSHFGEVIWARYASTSEIRDRYYENDARKKDMNVYAKLNYDLRRGVNVYLDLQFRRVDYQFLGFNDQLENVLQSAALNFFNPKAGIYYQVSEDASLYGSFAVGQREPNRDDYVDNPKASVPNPERLYNSELGFRKQWTNANFGVNLYHMYYQDQLVPTGRLNDVGAVTRVNVNQSYRAGIELVGGLQLTPALSFSANATLSNNKVKKLTEFIDVYDEDFNWLEQSTIEREDTDLPFSPAVIAGGEIAYQFLHKQDRQDLELALLGKYVSKQYLDLASDKQSMLDPYFFSDLRLQYRWQPGFVKEIGVKLLVQNLFNELYEANGWAYRYVLGETTYVDKGLYPQAETNFLLALTLSF